MAWVHRQILLRTSYSVTAPVPQLLHLLFSSTSYKVQSHTTMTSEKHTPPTDLADPDDHMSVHVKTGDDADSPVTHDPESSFGHHESPEWKAAERKIVRKLDMTLLPMVWVLYMFNYLDRNNIA